METLTLISPKVENIKPPTKRGRISFNVRQGHTLGEYDRLIEAGRSRCPISQGGIQRLEDFNAWKQKIQDKVIILKHIGTHSQGRVNWTTQGRYIAMSASCNSRYFKNGTGRIKRHIRKKLGQYYDADGVLLTLEYNPHKYTREQAWLSLKADKRRFFNTINRARYRQDRKKYHYLWAIEEIPEWSTRKDGTKHRNKSFGYPHIHVFFPKLQYLMPWQRLNGIWTHGDTDVTRIKVDCVGYVCKYVSKLATMTTPSQMLVWEQGLRIYGYSDSFVLPQPAEKPWEGGFWGGQRGTSTPFGYYSSVRGGRGNLHYPQPPDGKRIYTFCGTYPLTYDLLHYFYEYQPDVEMIGWN